MRAAVLGKPVSHSLSPVLHNAGYAAAGLAGWSYTAIECAEEELPALVAGLGPEWAGLSLTMPLKEVGLTVATAVSPVAAALRQLLEQGAEIVESPGDASVRFRTAKSEAELGKLLKRLIAANARVTQFREVQTDLEEAFMSFARPQDAAAAEASRSGGGVPAHA